MSFAGALERPTLLVIDDADLRTSQIAHLLPAVSNPGVPVRLLLLARSRSPWWTPLDTLTEGLLSGYDDGDLALSDPLSRSDHDEQFRQAYAAFRSALSDDEQRHRESPIPALPDLEGPAFADPLLVHLAALQSAADDPLALTDGPVESVTRGQVLAAYLGRETKRWQDLAAAQNPPITEPVEVLRRCVGLACLANPTAKTAAALESRAADLLRLIPDLSHDSDQGRRLRLARWLHTLHQGFDYWNPLRPDPLADQLLADLDILPELTATLLQRTRR